MKKKTTKNILDLVNTDHGFVWGKKQLRCKHILWGYSMQVLYGLINKFCLVNEDKEGLKTGWIERNCTLGKHLTNIYIFIQKILCPVRRIRSFNYH